MPHIYIYKEHCGYIPHEPYKEYKSLELAKKDFPSKEICIYGPSLQYLKKLEDDKNHIKVMQHEWYEANKKLTKERSKLAYHANSEKAIINHYLYMTKHPEKQKAYSKKYKLLNKEQIKIKSHNYYIRKKEQLKAKI
jgi:hypothetical protein